MKPVCHNCGNTGATGSPFVYDCTAPGCNVAENRTALEAALRADEAKRGKMDFEDALWFAFLWKPVAQEIDPA